MYSVGWGQCEVKLLNVQRVYTTTKSENKSYCWCILHVFTSKLKCV